MRACVHAQVLCILRVFMSLHLLLMWFVSCLSSVLVSLFMLYLYSFRSQFSVVGGILFTSTGLESPFYSSCCQTCFPSIVRPMNRLCELILKIFFHSPEMNRSTLFSMYLLRMTKKMNYFLRYLIFRERIFPWFNIDPCPSFNVNDSR